MATTGQTSAGNELRRRKFWLVLLVLALLVSMVGLGLMPSSNNSLLRDAIQSTGHFGFFGVIAATVSLATPLFLRSAGTQRWFQYVVGLVTAVSLGALLEIGQRFVPGRSSSLSDLMLDTLGAVTAICCLAWVYEVRSGNGLSSFRVKWLTILVCVGSVIGVAPLANCLWRLHCRNQAVPQLVNFRSTWSDSFYFLDEGAEQIERELPQDWPNRAEDNAVWMLLPKDESYPGLAIREPYPDWTPFKSLVFDIYLDGDESVPLAVRVHDLAHDNDYYDRFNTVVALQPGIQTVRISISEIAEGPRSRLLNLRQIAGLKLFVVKPNESIELAVGNLRLE